jgi:hypothetical protein
VCAAAGSENATHVRYDWCDDAVTAGEVPAVDVFAVNGYYQPPPPPPPP